jgi:hypothetical protein
MPAINETNLGSYQSEILFLLIGENPLPNYVAAKLLSKPFSDGRANISPILALIYSEETESYGKNLEGVLGKQDFRYCPIKVDPSDYYDISEKISSQLATVNSKVSVGLNYTGGTKAMAVHAYRAIKKLRSNAKFSYLDPRKKFMRFDENPQWIDISNVNSQAFDMTKISLDQFLALHEWEKMKRSADNPIKTIRCELTDLDFANFPNFNGDMFEDYILNIVLDLKDECYLHDIGANFVVSVPKENQIPFFEIDVVAIRGYQLFAISCTLEGRGNSAGKELRKSKLFEIAHRAKQLGGAEAQIGLICLADEDRTKLLKKQLRNDHIGVWGKADFKNVRTKLKSWFNA